MGGVYPCPNIIFEIFKGISFIWIKSLFFVDTILIGCQAFRLGREALVGAESCAFMSQYSPALREALSFLLHSVFLPLSPPRGAFSLRLPLSRYCARFALNAICEARFGGACFAH
jgi:hypothetical protein